MQTIRGTKDILPSEIKTWQELYLKALNIFNLYNYHEIRTPIIEYADVFLKSVGNSTDIVSKEMYRFTDQGKRDIALRPEGTASVARAVASNKLYGVKSIQKLWYMGPMFRYERPQYGRQRQFHQLGAECIGSENPMADVEVINLAQSILQKLISSPYTIEINSLGNVEERSRYKEDFKSFLENYKDELDNDSKRQLETNPLRILDSKNAKIQEIVEQAPSISQYLETVSRAHFDYVCEHLSVLDVPYKINTKLVRGLDYYNHTAFEICSQELKNKIVICGGGRYNNLIKQFGGPDLPGVGWAIGAERLLLLISKDKNKCNFNARLDIIAEGEEAQRQTWHLIQMLEKNNIMFNLNLENKSLHKKIKKASQNNSLGCLIIGKNEIADKAITVKWLHKQCQKVVQYNHIVKYLQKELEKYI